MTAPSLHVVTHSSGGKCAVQARTQTTKRCQPDTIGCQECLTQQYALGGEKGNLSPYSSSLTCRECRQDIWRPFSRPHSRSHALMVTTSGTRQDTPQYESQANNKRHRTTMLLLPETWKYTRAREPYPRMPQRYSPFRANTRPRVRSTSDCGYVQFPATLQSTARSSRR